MSSPAAHRPSSRTTTSSWPGCTIAKPRSRPAARNALRTVRRCPDPPAAGQEPHRATGQPGDCSWGTRRPGRGAADRREDLAPACPILGEASLIRYSTDDMISVLAFPAEPGSIEPARDPEDTMTTTTGPYQASGAGLIGPMPMALVGIRSSGRLGVAAWVGSSWRGRGVGRQVAIKLSVGGSRIHPEAQARFRMEALVVARLMHPNIVISTT